MKTYQIHLIRNGRTDDSTSGRYIGHTDAILSPEVLLNSTGSRNKRIILCGGRFYKPAQALHAKRHTRIYPERESHCYARTH